MTLTIMAAIPACDVYGDCAERGAETWKSPKNCELR
jgi:hypothetical protein